MNTTFTLATYAVTLLLLGLSSFKSKNKTRLALKKAWRMFWAVLPQFIAILLLVGLLLAILRPETIQRAIGSESGFLGLLVSALIGTVTMVPVLIAFPLASRLMENGAGVAQTAAFIATLTTVGIVTLPLETRYLGKKVAILRNLLFFLFALGTASVMGVVLG